MEQVRVGTEFVAAWTFSSGTFGDASPAKAVLERPEMDTLDGWNLLHFTPCG